MDDVKYEEWINATCPEGMDELTFCHLWLKFGILNGYFQLT